FAAIVIGLALGPTAHRVRLTGDDASKRDAVRLMKLRCSWSAPSPLVGEGWGGGSIVGHRPRDSQPPPPLPPPHKGEGNCAELNSGAASRQPSRSRRMPCQPTRHRRLVRPLSPAVPSAS